MAPEWPEDRIAGSGQSCYKWRLINYPIGVTGDQYIPEAMLAWFGGETATTGNCQWWDTDGD